MTSVYCHLDQDFCVNCRDFTDHEQLSNNPFRVCLHCSLISLANDSLEALALSAHDQKQLLAGSHFQCRCGCREFLTYELDGILVHACLDCATSPAFAYPDRFTTAVKNIRPVLPPGATWPDPSEAPVHFSCGLCQGGHYFHLRIQEQNEPIKCCGGCSTLFLDPNRYSCSCSPVLAR